MKTKFYPLLLTLLLMPSAYADIYLEMALESGGDQLIATNTFDSIDAGGGIKFAIGIQNPINEDGTAAMRLSLGYLFDSIDAYNGNAEFDTLTFDALYIINSGAHSFGIGGTMHMSPEYTDHVVGFQPYEETYDDALGILLQYGYQFLPNVELGLRVTNIEYESGLLTRDAGSIGIFISNGF